jgi:hypothetical protein
MSSSSSNLNVSCSLLQDLFEVALREYRQKTGNDIAADPLTMRLEHCDSPDAVLGILQEQAHAFNQVRNGDWKIHLLRRIQPIVNILLGLSTSGVFGQGIGLVRLTKSTYSLCKFIVHPAETSTSASNICWCWSPTRSMCPFSCLAVWSLDTQILKAAKGVSSSYDALIELFECFKHFLGRLEVLTEIPLAMGEILVKIMAELLNVLALATQQIRQGRFSESVLADTSH